MAPWVGSMRRSRQRTRVDLPEPERPMTTKTSPSWTSKLTSRIATTWPVRSRISRLSAAATHSSLRRESAWGPKIFHRPRTDIRTSFFSAVATVTPLPAPEGPTPIRAARLRHALHNVEATGFCREGVDRLGMGGGGRLRAGAHSTVLHPLYCSGPTLSNPFLFVNPAPSAKTAGLFRRFFTGAAPYFRAVFHPGRRGRRALRAT